MSIKKTTYIFTLFSAVLILKLANCKNNNIQRKIINGEIVEGYFINDSLLHGEVKFFNLGNSLVNKSLFSLGRKEGYSINFDVRGKVADSFNFSNGLFNGYQYSFDPNGEKKYVSYSYFGITCGPAIFYNKGIISRYLFLDLHKKPIVDVKYNNAGIPEKIEKFSTDTRVSPYLLLGKKVSNLFIYTPDVPGLNIKYSVGITDSKKNDSIMFTLKNKPHLFFDTILSRPNLGRNFIIKTILNGNGINKIYIEDLKW